MVRAGRFLAIAIVAPINLARRSFSQAAGLLIVRTFQRAFRRLLSFLSSCFSPFDRCVYMCVCAGPYVIENGEITA